MAKSEKYRDHCKCINKDIEINIVHISANIKPIKGCEQIIDFGTGGYRKMQIQNCKYMNTDECILKNYD
ncbi:hypothetical protein [Inconstantimicrobium mannanitabidum]|uniref:Uncharacterized protein n=1 Tax=Inconstantimicrobium mannanitabidum TaxID=1604901 RepID=A0ACB5RA69_9CLOT|nr:hypothetical protein [Clostridium sp. TW13]GKX66010.1 hypothetical protein rsdtw13_12680 [Clostridium sp. TW13]